TGDVKIEHIAILAGILNAISQEDAEGASSLLRVYEGVQPDANGLNGVVGHVAVRLQRFGVSPRNLLLRLAGPQAGLRLLLEAVADVDDLETSDRWSLFEAARELVRAVPDSVQQLMGRRRLASYLDALVSKAD